MSSTRTHSQNALKKKDDSAAELRTSTAGEPVIISPGRAARPSDFRPGAKQRCPFCPGNESDTPPEVFALRDEGVANQAGWSIRVVPNLYPFCSADPTDPAYGRHEVIIDTPDHQAEFADLGPGQIARCLEAYQARLLAARSDHRLAYASVFKNHGEGSGASRKHAHSQLMATTFVPPRVARESTVSAPEENTVLSCDRIRAFAPPASRFPFELAVGPISPESAFEDAATSVVHELAGAISCLLMAMNRMLDRPDYHLMVCTAPFRGENRDCYGWRVEIVPRLTKVAGFEWASGVFVNQHSPAAAVERYRLALGEQS